MIVQNSIRRLSKAEKVNIDRYGQVTISEKEAIEALYQGLPIADMILDNLDRISQFNKSKEQNRDNFDLLPLPNLNLPEDIKDFDQANQSYWFMPDKYKNMDIEGFLVNQCPKQNYERLVEELELFRQHNMITLLKYLKYLVDTMRENSVVWGVGRGSSVASYVLYLIGVHKIDSVKYNLDIKEFLK